ncbi:hypothetical protein [Actinoplanes sp. NPDC051851]|uniref:hypothetical protein n=1 Tax=Actinoplanes sp. NPDC051851 TaxID=3154753 RepID=UPI003416DF8A
MRSEFLAILQTAGKRLAAHGRNRLEGQQPGGRRDRPDGRAIGYVEAFCARADELTTALVDGVAPADAAAARTVEQAMFTGTDLRLELDYRNAYGGAYPMVQVTHEVVCWAGTREPARGLLAYASSEAGQAAAVRAGYAPLPAALRARVAEAVAALG